MFKPQLDLLAATVAGNPEAEAAIEDLRRHFGQQGDQARLDPALDDILQAHPNAVMHCERTVVYRGPAAWLRRTLLKSLDVGRSYGTRTARVWISCTTVGPASHHPEDAQGPVHAAAYVPPEEG